MSDANPAALINNQSDRVIQKKGRGGKREGAGRKVGALSEASKKINEAKSTLRDLALEHVPKAVETLAKIAKDSPSDQAKVAAIKELFDRAYGKAPQAITGEDGGPMKQVVEIVWATAGKAN